MVRFVAFVTVPLLALAGAPPAEAATAGTPGTTGTPAAGTVREWFGFDATTGAYYRKAYQLRAVGEHLEVWLARDRSFPAGDCRQHATAVSDEQLAELAREFDRTIRPRQATVFGTPPDRDGTKARAAGTFTGDGDKAVALIDNIRDENYYRYPAVGGFTTGFFSAELTEKVDRNVITIDAYDWRHRFGADPVDEPAGDQCASGPAWPRMYEASFAHEWQHLLMYYVDRHEAAWLNEGLSDFASTLAGYVDTRATVEQRGSDLHLTCFQGFATVKTRHNTGRHACGGPQNSLTWWNETGPGELPADYGNAFQFLVYLRDRFGAGIVSALHRDGQRQGLASVRAALPPGTDLADVVHDYQVMTLVDRVVGEPGGTIRGVPAARVTAASLRSTVNLANPAAYALPGAAPNGADYVRLPTPVRSVAFRGATKLPPRPLGWTVADRTLFSGNRSDLDSFAVRPLTVPSTGGRLELETAFDLESRFDWGYLMVSTDGGRSYTAVRGDRTTAGPDGPGLTGASGGVITAGFDLSPYAGRKLLWGLRYVSDGVGNRGGWRIGAVTLGGAVISDGSTLDGWRSPGHFAPTQVHGWHVRLVGLDAKRARVVPLDEFARLAGYPTVVAIVSYDEPTESVTQYAPYRLVVNGVLQPGGSKP